MSITCDAGHGCKITCPGDSCMALYFPDTGECVTACCDVRPSDVIKSISTRAGSDARVSASISNAELAKVAFILEHILQQSVAIPAAKAYDRITETLENKTMAEIVDLLSLSLSE